MFFKDKKENQDPKRSITEIPQNQANEIFNQQQQNIKQRADQKVRDVRSQFTNKLESNQEDIRSRFSNSLPNDFSKHLGDSQKSIDESKHKLQTDCKDENCPKDELKRKK